MTINFIPVADIMQRTLAPGQMAELGLRFKSVLPQEQWLKWAGFGYANPELGCGEELNDRVATIADDKRMWLRDDIVKWCFTGRTKTQRKEVTYFSLGGGAGSGDKLLEELGLLGDTRLAHRMQMNRPIITDHEPVRKKLIQIEQNGYDRDGRLLDPRLRDLYQHEISCTLTAVLHNAVANGHDCIMNWTSASGAVGQFRHLRETAQDHGKDLKVVMVATMADIGLALERKAAQYAEHNEYQTVRGVLYSHKGFAQCFDEITAEVDELYLFDTSRGKYEQVARKTGTGRELEVLSKQSFSKLQKQANINLDAGSLAELYEKPSPPPKGDRHRG